MSFDAWLDEAKVVKATYRPELHTYELEVRPDGATTVQVVMLNGHFFPAHPPMQFLDESLQIHEDVKVILKDEQELALMGWKLEEQKKKMMAHPKSKFLIGKTKKKMLGGVYNAKIGITASMEPYVFIDKYRFGPGEVKCVLKSSDVKILTKAKTLIVPTEWGNFSYNAEKKILGLPQDKFGEGGISALVSFLRKAYVI